MNITNPTHRAIWRQRAQKRKAWSANAVAAKARKRLERGDVIPDEADCIAPKLPPLKYATVTIRCGGEAVTFRVYRYDEKRMLARGKAQAAATIGRRVALTLEAIL